MGIVTADITTSLDGYIAGPNVALDRPLGDGGEKLHRWMYPLEAWREPQGRRGGDVNRDSDVVAESSARAGAFVMGRRMFDTGEGPWGPTPPFRRPVFIVTHRPRETVTKDGGTTFTFVTDGVVRAVELARASAGEKDVAISGGAEILRQVLEAGLLDEIQIHLSPVLLGDGTRLFQGLAVTDLGVQIDRVIDSPAVTHLRYRIVRPKPESAVVR